MEVENSGMTLSSRPGEHAGTPAWALQPRRPGRGRCEERRDIFITDKVQQLLCSRQPDVTQLRFTVGPLVPATPTCR
ncbi:hypothetical protein F01_470004 [Burkholderia cenocepacia]|nr:hypothetical protein F01_470004 [Burkholderia cenocepacia]